VMWAVQPGEQAKECVLADPRGINIAVRSLFIERKFFLNSRNFSGVRGNYSRNQFCRIECLIARENYRRGVTEKSRKG
jgi:hypothetical protein